MVRTLMANRSNARHELDTKLLQLREDFHDACKKVYEDARRDVEELKRQMDAEARALEEEFQMEFPEYYEAAEARVESDVLTNRLDGAPVLNEHEAKSITSTIGKANGKIAAGRGYKAKRGGHSTASYRNDVAGTTAINVSAVREDEVDTDFNTPADSNVNSVLEEEISINDSEASTEILAPSTPASKILVDLKTKRRHEHTGSSSSLSPPPEGLDSQSSTPSRARNRKQRKSAAGVAPKIGQRTTRSSKPENKGRAGHDETIGFSWVVSMIGWDPADGTSELPVTWRRDISLKMKQPDFNSFEPYIGVENRGKLFPKMVLDGNWDGIAFYDKPSRRFEIFKKNRERLRIQFEDSKYWVFGENQRIEAQEVPSFMTAFKAELGSKIIVEESSHLGEASDFMTESADSHPDHLARLQVL